MEVCVELNQRFVEATIWFDTPTCAIVVVECVERMHVHRKVWASDRHELQGRGSHCALPVNCDYIVALECRNAKKKRNNITFMGE